MYLAAILRLVTIIGCYGEQIFNCDFETTSDFRNGNFCGLLQLTSDNYDWLRGQTTPSGFTGPQNGDHTIGTNGHFAFIEASGQAPETYADVVLPSVSGSLSYCLRFFYHMYGPHIGRLEVRKVDADNNQEVAWVKEREGVNGLNEWIEAGIDYDSSVTRIGIRGVRGGSDEGEPFGDIAIDDIAIDNTRCDGTIDDTSSTADTTPTPAPTIASTTITIIPTTITTTITTLTTTPRSTTPTETVSTLSSTTETIPTSTLPSTTKASTTTSYDFLIAFVVILVVLFITIIGIILLICLMKRKKEGSNKVHGVTSYSTKSELPAYTGYSLDDWYLNTAEGSAELVEIPAKNRRSRYRRDK